MIKILELFGGVGAPRKALINLGVEHKAIDYVEIDEKTVRTYNALFKEFSEYKKQDIRDWNLKPDILVHGSPCQDFSIAGKQLGASPEIETRSSLMWETIKIIQNMGVWKPRVVIWENVRNVLSKHMKINFDRYLIEMKKLGYSNSYKVLNAMDFGIPQKRERVFTISLLGEKKFDFSKLEKVPLKNISEFLEKETDDKYIITQPSMLKKIGDGDNNFQGRLTIVKDWVYTITTKQLRCPNSGIIDLNNGKYRLLTEKECWRLMGFDDKDFEAALKVIPGRTGCLNNSLYKQAGNSIVVPILEAIFKEII